MGQLLVQPNGVDAGVQVYYTAEAMKERKPNGDVVWEDHQYEDSSVYHLRRVDGSWRISWVRET